MKLKKVLALVLALALVVTAFAACGQSGTSDGVASTFKPKKVDEAKNINLNAGMEPTGLNSLKTTYSIEFSLLRHMYENLVMLDNENKVVPGAAESWDYNEETLTYTFHLREDGVWTNGEKVTANDFAFAWQQALSPETASDYAYFLYILKNGEAFFNGECEWEDVGVKVVDDYTLEVTLEQPTAYALSQFTFGTFSPINQKFYEAVGADKYATEAQYFCTNGAFALTEWAHNEKIVLQKNDAWHGAENVEVEQITWKIITDGNTALTSFLAGELDMVGLGTGELIKQAKEAGAKIESYADGSAFYFQFNHKNQYIANKNLRQALFLAIDKQGLVDAVWQNDNKAMTSFTTPAILGADGKPFADSVGELYGIHGDPAKAKEYLDKALEELNCTIEDLNANLSIDCGDSAVATAEAAYYQEQWRQNLGIEVTVNPMITKQNAQNRSDGNFVMSCTGWGPDYNDPNTFLDLWCSDSGNNQSGFASEEYDTLIEKAAVETDLAKRQEYFIEVEKIIAEELPMAPMYWRYPSYACSDKIKGGMHRSTFQDINATYVKLS